MYLLDLQVIDRQVLPGHFDITQQQANLKDTLILGDLLVALAQPMFLLMSLAAMAVQQHLPCQQTHRARTIPKRILTGCIRRRELTQFQALL